ENRIAPLWVGVRRHQSTWLVIEEKPCSFARPQRRAVDRNLVGWCNVEGGRRNNLAVDRDASGLDPRFGLTPGGKTRARDDLRDARAGPFLGGSRCHMDFFTNAFIHGAA